ncbi:hypothetical protein ACFC0M_30690 [Streptomyces sp. NPDC056149]|uniref:hypothetical protein n=1 Tax=unclassified Streptomyces TaxID=2593676 RepID=UPI0023818A77|nr:hypothetical protein [Streptomyces sp. WZ-12]
MNSGDCDHPPDRDGDDVEMREVVRELARALETMLNLIKADALPVTPEARALMHRTMAFLDESTDRFATLDHPGEILPLAAAINKMVNSTRQQIHDDVIAASPPPDHPTP